MNTEEHEIYEYARKRINQKKRLYFHLIFLIVGSLFLFIANKWLKFGEAYDWYLWAITAWIFIFILHVINVFVINVFVINRFMDKNWEHEQINKLMALQKTKIEALKTDIENNK